MSDLLEVRLRHVASATGRKIFSVPFGTSLDEVIAIFKYWGLISDGEVANDDDFVAQFRVDTGDTPHFEILFNG